MLQNFKKFLLILSFLISFIYSGNVDSNEYHLIRHQKSCRKK